METYRLKREAIQCLTENAKQILEIVINGESTWFKVSMFEPPVGGSVSALPYLTFSGVDITAFILGDVLSTANKFDFLTRFEAKFSKEKDSMYKFSDNHTWRYYA